jgi:hypothetical protein
MATFIKDLFDLPAVVRGEAPAAWAKPWTKSGRCNRLRNCREGAQRPQREEKKAGD